ncbi:hypothetical protein C8F01DRAFT_1140033 [Mycena amicta]|nr:hypothetical protein C8F01DRAFT_1168640 [Mycena amicta]KAJ7061446.1 hypothetical protein C8F01DRAFT_1140033 [Mycena amicta]
MSRSPGPLYTVASCLSLTHMASSLATILVYDMDDARDSQVIAILYSVVTFYMVAMLIPHTTSKDNDPVSRLNKQFVIVNFLLLCWLLSIGLVPLTVGPGLRPLISSCAERAFFSPVCITLGLDMVIPFALIGTLTSISWRIYHNAHHIQSQSQSLPVPIPAPPEPPSSLTLTLTPYTDAPPTPRLHRERDRRAPRPLLDV